MTKAEKRAAWRRWYRKNKKKMSKYYKARYAERVQNETPAKRKKRLKKQRAASKRYHAKHKKKINAKRRKQRQKGKKTNGRHLRR